MTTYTVYSMNSGTVEGRGLTAEQAADIILTNDGARYELRREDRGGNATGESAWSIYAPNPLGEWVPVYDGPSPHGRLLRVYAASEAEAWAKLASTVLTVDWRGGLSCMADAEYDAMMAELASEEGAA